MNTLALLQRDFPVISTRKLVIFPTWSFITRRYAGKAIPHADETADTDAKGSSSNKGQCPKKFGILCQPDIYGPPHPISNMPSVEFFMAKNETVKSKKQHLLKRENPDTKIDEKEHADDLSIFYKDFLDKNFTVHLKYQREWYKKNFQLLWYGLQVKMEKLLDKCKNKFRRQKKEVES